jgi:hypothetical protein
MLRRMPTPDPRDAAEAAFRALLDEGGLPEPDEVVDDGPGELVFLFHEPRVAIVVEYDAAGHVRAGDGP